MFSTTNNKVLHALKFTISINLESVFYQCYTVFLPLREVNNSVMSVQIRTMPWFPNVEELKLLMLCWRSLSGCSREHFTVDFASKGCQYLMNGCLELIGAWITQDAKLKIVDALLTLILSMGRWPCCCLFCLYKLAIRQWCITATK